MELPLEGTLVRRVTNEWGEIADESSEIRTRVVLDARHLLDVHIDSVGLRYDASMNGVRVARSEKKGVSLNRRNTTIHLSAHIHRSRLLDWWKTHLNNGEKTRLVIRPHLTVDLPSLDLSAIDFAGVLPRRNPSVNGISVETPNYTSRFSTSILDSIRTRKPMPVKALGKKIFEVREVDASWGKADDTETPVDLAVTVENPNLFSVGFENLGYAVEMNGVRVGGGEVDDFVLPARDTATVETRAVLRNEKIADWWTTHLRRGESTETEITFDGTVRLLRFGRRVGGRSYTDSFRTDFFAGGLPRHR